MSIELYGTKKTINSREVADMLGKEHSYVMEMIQGRVGKLGIVPVLENANLAVSDYFIPSEYSVEGQSRKYPCYEVTKMGCEMLGNKLQGEKGILFTAKYVKRFNDMEEAIKNPIGVLESMAKELKETKERLDRIESTNKKLSDILTNGSKREVKKLLPKNMENVEKLQLLIFSNLDRYTTCIKDGKRIMDRKPINDDCKRLFGMTPCSVKRALDLIEGVESSSKVCNSKDKIFRACVVNL